MTRFRLITACLLVGVLAGSFALGQGYRRRGSRRGGYGYSFNRSRNPANVADRRGVPIWDMDAAFDKDVFTFVRIIYNERGSWTYPWTTDYPDSDLNFSYRLQELTSLKVHPNGKTLRLTDEKLFDYPFIYLVEPGDLMLTDAEVKALRRYLLSGGFMMVDDFWSTPEWDQFYSQIRRVFPDRYPVEISIDHPIFHCVYDLKEKPQVPSIGDARRGYSWQPNHGPTARDVHYWIIEDDHDRMMVFIGHNTDLGDGWEREGEDRHFFEEFSVKQAYPMGINVVFWAMTH